jgi:hypothetical protein
MVCVDRFLAFQLGLVQPSVARTASAAFDELPPLATLPVSFAIIIPWMSKVDIMSAEVVMVYNEGIVGSHLIVGGIDRIIMPLQASSVIAVVLRLSTAALHVQSCFTCSWMSVPLAYKV